GSAGGDQRVGDQRSLYPSFRPVSDPAWSGPDPTGTAYTTSTTPATVTLRPNHLHNANIPSDQRSLQRWFDPTAFAPPTPGSFGTAAQGVIIGPGISTLHGGMSREFLVFHEP